MFDQRLAAGDAIVYFGLGVFSWRENGCFALCRYSFVSYLITYCLSLTLGSGSNLVRSCFFFFIILVCKLKYTLFQIFSCCSTSFKS